MTFNFLFEDTSPFDSSPKRSSFVVVDTSIKTKPVISILMAQRAKWSEIRFSFPINVTVRFPSNCAQQCTAAKKWNSAQETSIFPTDFTFLNRWSILRIRFHRGKRKRNYPVALRQCQFCTTLNHNFRRSSIGTISRTSILANLLFFVLTKKKPKEIKSRKRKINKKIRKHRVK